MINFRARQVFDSIKVRLLPRFLIGKCKNEISNIYYEQETISDFSVVYYTYIHKLAWEY